MVSTQPYRPTETRNPSTVREAYRLRADASLVAAPDGEVTLRHSRFELALTRLGAGRRAVVLRLAEEWLDDNQVSQLVGDIEGEARILPTQLLLRRLIAHSWLERRLQDGETPMVDIRPRGLGPESQPRSQRHEPATRYRLARHTIIRGDGDRLVAYSPLSTVALAFANPRAAAILTLLATDARDAAELEQAGITERLLDEALTAGIVVSAADSEAQAVAPPHVLWSPEELAVHDRSRVGHHVLPVGGTYRFKGRFAPEPVRPNGAGAGGPVVALSIPDLAERARSEPSFTAVTEARRSIREHDDEHPITLDQLGEFLYRVGRTWDVRESAGQEVGRRPYPTGGQICELELYPLVTQCVGLAPALYHYDSVDHRLELVAEHDHLTARLLRYARAAATMTDEPQVLIVCTARMTRLMWKYEGLAYPMALKDAGVLTGLMYLVATVMGLAPCGVGSGDSAAFAAMSGLDPLVEPSVADFLLGSAKASMRQPAKASMRPPAKASMRPPAEASMRPPAEASMRPPAEASMRQPAKTEEQS